MVRREEFYAFTADLRKKKLQFVPHDSTKKGRGIEKAEGKWENERVKGERHNETIFCGQVHPLKLL